MFTILFFFYYAVCILVVIGLSAELGLPIWRTIFYCLVSSVMLPFLIGVVIAKKVKHWL